MTPEFARLQNRKTRMICRTCKSDDVKADAFALWDGWSWQISDVFDKGAYCETCDGETRLEEVPV